MLPYRSVTHQVVKYAHKMHLILTKGKKSYMYHLVYIEAKVIPLWMLLLNVLLRKFRGWANLHVK